MAEITYRSPGVYTTEIDLTGPTTAVPVGVPAGIIGTANEGPAYIPLTVGSYSDYARIFGATDGEKFGPLAVNQFLKNATACTYLRVLGIGDGKQRNSSTGKVTSAGFIVGSQQVQSNGNVGSNPYAVFGGSEGRTLFLGCYMSQSAGNTEFTDANIQYAQLPSTASVILRGVLLTPSGVVATLSASQGGYGGGSDVPLSSVRATTNGPVNTNLLKGGPIGGVDKATSRFVMLLNGHKSTSDSPNAITASFELTDGSYFSNVFNTDPLKIEEKGHLLYAHYDIHPARAVVTGAGRLNNDAAAVGGGPDKSEPIAFLASGSLVRNTGAAATPNYESFEERFTTPASPFVTSQVYGASPWDLFRIHSLGDGAYSNSMFKITIENLQPSRETNGYGKFDLIVRRFHDTDYERRALESYRGLTLNPSDERYIGRVIGDMNSYFDFDQSLSSQKIVIQGSHPVRSNYIRVEIGNALAAGKVPNDAMPMGHRGVGHLVTSGSSTLGNFFQDPAVRLGGPVVGTSPELGCSQANAAVAPPVPFRENVKVGNSPFETVETALHWGIQFMQKTSATNPNLISTPDNTIEQLTKFFPSYGKSNMDFFVSNNAGIADRNSAILDVDRFNNNAFSLERISVRTGSDTNADPEYWVSASYHRNPGSISINSALKTRALKVDDFKISGNRTFGKYTFIVQGGFDGSNIFNKDKQGLLDPAVRREMDDSTSQGGTSGPTVSAYRKALDIMGTKSDVEIKLLAVPGLRHTAVTDYAIDTVENRFDALYIMDIEEKDALNAYITSSKPEGEFWQTTSSGQMQSVFPNVTYTTRQLRSRALDSSFAAAYFPDVVLTDPTTNTNVQVPPSVAVLGAFSLNDRVGYQWFAPAGFTRGAMSDVLSTRVSLNKDNKDTLYDADINPVIATPNNGIVVFGQKTLLQAASALDRVNVRRLLIYIRRQVRNVANRIIFEPNRQETLDKFNSLVQPILQTVQERSGVDRYKVIIDATTTTQADVENNTLRGKIFIQPTRTAEFVALDFTLTNAGDAFDQA